MAAGPSIEHSMMRTPVQGAGHRSPSDAGLDVLVVRRPALVVLALGERVEERDHLLAAALDQVHADRTSDGALLRELRLVVPAMDHAVDREHLLLVRPRALPVGDELDDERRVDVQLLVAPGQTEVLHGARPSAGRALEHIVSVRVHRSSRHSAHAHSALDGVHDEDAVTAALVEAVADLVGQLVVRDAHRVLLVQTLDPLHRDARRPSDLRAHAESLRGRRGRPTCSGSACSRGGDLGGRGLDASVVDQLERPDVQVAHALQRVVLEADVLPVAARTSGRALMPFAADRVIRPRGSGRTRVRRRCTCPGPRSCIRSRASSSETMHGDARRPRRTARRPRIAGPSSRPM